MRKSFRLKSHSRFLVRWRGAALTLLIVSAGLLYWDPPQLVPYRTALQWSAGLALLVLGLSVVVALLAWASINETALTIQLPFWRVRIPLEAIRATRLASIERIIPLRHLDDDLIGKSVVIVELREWPQSRQLLQLWLGRRMVLQEGIVLMVGDWFAFQQLLDDARAEVREQRRQETS